MLFFYPVLPKAFFSRGSRMMILEMCHYASLELHTSSVASVDGLEIACELEPWLLLARGVLAHTGRKTRIVFQKMMEAVGKDESLRGYRARVNKFLKILNHCKIQLY